MPFVREFWDFVKSRARWFVPPIVILVVILAGHWILWTASDMSPKFIYPQI